MLLSYSFVAISEKEAAWENKQKLIVCPGNEQIQGFLGGKSSELETANYWECDASKANEVQLNWTLLAWALFIISVVALYYRCRGRLRRNSYQLRFLRWKLAFAHRANDQPVKREKYKTPRKEGCIRDVPGMRCSFLLAGIILKTVHFSSDISIYHSSHVIYQIHLHFLHHLFWVPALFVSNTFWAGKPDALPGNRSQP